MDLDEIMIFMIMTNLKCCLQLISAATQPNQVPLAVEEV